MLFPDVPQISVLGPLYIANMFFRNSWNIDFAGYADDNTAYAYSSNIQNMLGNLQGALEKMLYRFSTNHSVANAVNLSPFNKL